MAKDFFGFTCNLFAAHQLNKFCNSALQLSSSAWFQKRRFDKGFGFKRGGSTPFLAAPLD